MPRLRWPSPALAALLFLPAPSWIAAQQADSAAACGPCPRHRPALAIAEALGINVLVNRYDAVVRGERWAYTGPTSWSRNLRLGWEWDENAFGTNMFSHPYHGSLYFNAGRANGLSFWESAPLAFAGSATWEFFGEEFRPALNDFFMTSFGGITLGEVYHRVASSIRDERLHGSHRLVRELASLPFDPVGGLNRLVRGQWWRHGPNIPEHDPGAYVLRMLVGARALGETGTDSTISGSPTILAELNYGDPFVRPYREPFDVFALRTQISPGGGGLNVLRAAGRLYGRDITRASGKHRHLFEINQRYDYVSNPAYKYGAQSVEGGVISRWQLRGRTGVRTRLAADLIFLGAIDAPYAGFGDRTYDFGPGAGLSLEIALERDGVALLTFTTHTEYLHSVSGATADHYVGFGGLEATLPIRGGAGIGATIGYFSRLSRYSDKAAESREFPEARVFLTWTASVHPRPVMSP